VLLPLIEFEDFTKVQIASGTITHADENFKARAPAYVLTIDFGELGNKTSSAQITDHYTKDDLIGLQIVAVVNFPSKRIAGVKSEVLVLGCVNEDDSVVLLQPNKPVKNGLRVM